jgi:DNA mismatch repair protein MutS2
MSSGFSSCDSGLARLHRFAEYAKGTDGYGRLIALLDYDNHLAAVTLNLRIGADGHIRRFEVSKMSENRDNRFHQSPFRRFLTRFRMLLRGYIFSEGELVNRWVDSVYDGISGLLSPLIQLIGEMEFYLSALGFKELAESKGLKVCFSEMIDLGRGRSSGEVGYEIFGLFNPLLFGQGIVPVPCDLEADKWETISVVTGPNSGGKTRLLQGIAIAQMLAQSGMYAPAAKATLSRAAGLFVSLVEEARADQKEGRLGTELIRIRHLFERSRPGSLVVLDELCSGTNPSEGEEIFRLVISLLHQLDPSVFITTHFLQFAARLAAESEGNGHLRFLQVELDEDECPTFRFKPGVARTSLAHQTAARLGVTKEELLALVRRNRKAPEKV